MNRITRNAVVAFAPILLLVPVATLCAREIHVAPPGNNANSGTKDKPLKTIAAAANVAQPGDVITVHAGIYRERVNPPRGGTSDTKRIVYQAAPGEEVTITGSELAKGWEEVQNDTWQLTLPNSYFGNFNPFAEAVDGDWFNGHGRVHHRACVYLDNVWLPEAVNLNQVVQPASKTPLWFATVSGVAANESEYLLNVAWFRPTGAEKISASKPARRTGTRKAACAEGGECVGFIRKGNWLSYDNVDFGNGTASVEIRAAAAPGTGGTIELHVDKADGELLGTCDVTTTGNWQKWQTFTAKIKKTEGKKNLCLVFNPAKPAKAANEPDNTVIYAQFPGVNPNEAKVEISVRSTVFTPEKTNIDYITVRGFDLRNAATNWAAPTSGQNGLITAYWCKGWIIENNEISYSRCCGIALGKYSDQWDGNRGSTEGYYLTIDDALKKGGWTKEKIGSHIARNNHIHHCGQTGIVGSLGCSFSKIIGNEIHDINMQGIWGGAEMAGIKFHGAIDVVISDNHIYRCGEVAGLWLDWMAQGTHVRNNLFHDNQTYDIFTEVDHGPFLIANNIMLSPTSYLGNSQGGAYAHNLVVGRLDIDPDERRTPYHKAHSTEMVGLHNCPVGDARWYNNLLASRCTLSSYNKASWPVAAAGNVFTKGAHPSKFDTEYLVKPDVDIGVKLTQTADGCYLEINADTKWASEQKRKVVTTEVLGKAKIPDLPFENADGTSLRVDTDYFGNKRDTGNPFPGPFEIAKSGAQTIKVWPKPAQVSH